MTDATSREPIARVLQSVLRRARGDDAGEVRGLQRLTGGATKHTWSFDWSCGSDTTGLILQQTTTRPAAPSTGKLRRPKLSASEDAALMTHARRHGVPAPEVIAVLAPEDGIGEGYVTGRVEGFTLGRDIVRHEQLASARPLLAVQCADALARIHSLPQQELSFLQSLSPDEELLVYGGVLGEYGIAHPALEYAARWVRENLPTNFKPGVVHADFRTGNLIVGPEGLRCVLDWEIARIGDPMQDIGVLCMRTWRFGGAPEVGGFGPREQLYAAYEEASGVPIDPKRALFWEAFANLKWAISCVVRGLGSAPGGVPASMELGAVGRRLEEPLWDFMELVNKDC